MSGALYNKSGSIDKMAINAGGFGVLIRLRYANRRKQSPLATRGSRFNCLSIEEEPAIIYYEE